MKAEDPDPIQLISERENEHVDVEQDHVDDEQDEVGIINVTTVALPFVMEKSSDERMKEQNLRLRFNLKQNTYFKGKPIIFLVGDTN